jgi:hypothetical protein
MTNVDYLLNQKKRQITLNDWCSAFYNCEIIPFPVDKIKLIHSIAQRTITLKNEAEKKGRRVNEQGNDTEDFLLKAMKEVLGGNIKTLGTGYPDIMGRSEKLEYPIIADSKIKKNLNEKGTLRIFYTSTPSEKTKQKKKLETSYHLLFMFEHDGNEVFNGNYSVHDMNGFKYIGKGTIQEGSYNDILNHNKIIARSNVDSLING